MLLSNEFDINHFIQIKKDEWAGQSGALVIISLFTGEEKCVEIWIYDTNQIPTSSCQE